MAVPTVNTIKLSDVCLEIYGSTSTAGKSLLGCHTNATGTFNPTYAVTGNTLLDFRGYSHSVSLSPITSTWATTHVNTHTTRVTNDGGTLTNSTWLNSDLTAVGQNLWENYVMSHYSAAGGYKTSINKTYSIKNNEGTTSDGTITTNRLGTSYNRPAMLLEATDSFTYTLNTPLKNDYSIYINVTFIRNGVRTDGSTFTFSDGVNMDSELHFALDNSNNRITITTAGDWFANVYKTNLTDDDLINAKLLFNITTTSYDFYMNGAFVGSGSKNDVVMTDFHSANPFYPAKASSDLYQIIMFDGLRSSAQAIALTTR